MGIIAWPFGKILWLCYLLVKNYGLALLLFTIVIKLIMLPSSAKQQKSMAKMARLSPKLEQIKKKYANNRDKQNEATMELYNQENVNPMGSCLPMVLTFVILFAVIDVVYAPLTYLGNIPKETLTEGQTVAYDVYTVSNAIKEYKPDNGSDVSEGTTVSSIIADGGDLYDTLLVIKSQEKSSLSNLTDERLAVISDILIAHPGMDEYFTDTSNVSERLIAGGASSRIQLLMISIAKEYPDLFDAEISKLCEEIDYTFLGVYLGEYPSWSSILILIPIISLISQLALTIVSQYYQKKNGSSATQNGSMNLMLYGMPVISFIIAFNFPAGIGIYWIFSSVLSLVQTVGLNVYYTPARMEKIIAKENKKARKRPSLYQQMLEAQKAELQGRKPEEPDFEEEDTEEVKLSRSERKEAEKKALNEARRRYAEKYGDSLDVADDDDK